MALRFVWCLFGASEGVKGREAEALWKRGRLAYDFDMSGLSGRQIRQLPAVA
jgi:hypothetical protein